MTAFEDENVWSLIIDVVEVVRPSTDVSWLGCVINNACSAEDSGVLVPENFCVFLPNQKAEQRQPFGTSLVRHCPQGFSPFFTFLRAIFFRRFRLPSPPLSGPGSPRMRHDVRDDGVNVWNIPFTLFVQTGRWSSPPLHYRPGLEQWLVKKTLWMVTCSLPLDCATGSGFGGDSAW